MVFHALISPQGHVEYNAKFLVDIKKLRVGKWYSSEELCKMGAMFLRECPQSIERNIKKWRYEIQQLKE